MLAKRASRVCLIVVLGALLLGGSCRVRTEPPEPVDRPITPGAGAGAGAASATPERPVDVGDAEAALKITLTIPQPVPANFGVEELKDARGNLDMVTANVAPPYPQKFDVALTVKSSKPFVERPLLVRLSVLRDGQAIESQTVTVSGDATKNPFSYTFDALKGLTSAPATMLLHAQAEIIMLPEGTDVASIDPATVSGTPETTGSRVSNPLRINFTGQAAAP